MNDTDMKVFANMTVKLFFGRLRSFSERRKNLHSHPICGRAPVSARIRILVKSSPFTSSMQMLPYKPVASPKLIREPPIPLHFVGFTIYIESDRPIVKGPFALPCFTLKCRPHVFTLTDAYNIQCSNPNVLSPHSQKYTRYNKIPSSNAIFRRKIRQQLSFRFVIEFYRRICPTKDISRNKIRFVARLSHLLFLLFYKSSSILVVKLTIIKILIWSFFKIT